MFNPTTKQAKKLKEQKKVERYAEWAAVTQQVQQSPKQLTKVRSRRVFERDGVEAWDVTGVGSNLNVTNANFTPRETKKAKAARRQQKAHNNSSGQCICNGNQSSGKSASPKRDNYSPSLKKSSSIKFEVFGSKSSQSRSPKRNARLRQRRGIRKELVDNQISPHQFTQSQNLARLQQVQERISSTVSELHEHSGGQQFSSEASSSTIPKIAAQQKMNPDMDVMRRGDPLPENQHYTKEQIHQLRLYQRSEETLNYQHIEEQKQHTPRQSKSPQKKGSHNRGLKVSPDSSLRFTRSGFNQDADKQEYILDDATSSGLLQKSAMRGVNVGGIGGSNESSGHQHDGSYQSFMSKAPDYQTAKHTSFERLQQQKEARANKKKLASGVTLSRSPRKRKSPVSYSAAMYDKNACGYEVMRERRKEHKRNAQLFKSIELPKTFQSGEKGGCWAPTMGPQTTRGAGYDRLIMSWAAGEKQSTDRTRSSMAVDRLDSKVDQIVKKYCRLEEKPGDKLETITRYRQAANMTTIEDREMSRYAKRDLLDIAVKKNDEIFEKNHFLGSKTDERAAQYKEFNVRRRLMTKDLSQSIPLTFTINNDKFDEEMREGLSPYNCPIRPAESPPRFRWQSRSEMKEVEIQKEVDKLSQINSSIDQKDRSPSEINVQSKQITHMVAKQSAPIIKQKLNDPSRNPSTMDIEVPSQLVISSQLKIEQQDTENEPFNPLAGMADDEVLNMDPGYLVKYHALMNKDVSLYEQTDKSSKTFTAEDIVSMLKLTFNVKREPDSNEDDLTSEEGGGGQRVRTKRKEDNEWPSEKKKSVEAKLKDLLTKLEKNVDIRTVSDYDEVAQSVRINGMAHFDQTMRKIAKHCRKMLDVGVNDVYKHIEKTIFDHKAEPSPLLKFYNDVMKHTEFEIPPRVKLNSDLDVFKSLLKKYRRAQELECTWIRNQAVEEGKLYIQRQFDATRKALFEECLMLLKKHDDIMNMLAEAEMKNKRYCEKLIAQEGVMANMWTYFLHIRGETIREDFDIYDLNQREPASRRACKRACLKMVSPTEYAQAGAVEVHNLIYEKELEVKGFVMSESMSPPLSPSPRKSARLSLSPTRQQSEVSYGQQTVSDGKTTSQIVLSAALTVASMKTSSALVAKAQKDGESAKGLVKEEQISNKLQKAIRFRLKDQLKKKVEDEEESQKDVPFVTEAERQQRLLAETHSELKCKAFNLYGNYTELKMEEKIKAVEGELLRHFTLKFQKQEDQRKNRENEYSLLYDICRQAMKDLDDQTSEVKKLRAENQEATKKYDQMLRQKNQQFDSTVKQMNENFEKQFERCKNIYGIENKVLQHIVDRQMIDVVQNRFKTDRLRSLLRIPRTSLGHIQNYGVFDFIKQCRDAIGEQEEDLPERPRSPLPFNFAVATMKRIRGQSQTVQSTMNLKGKYDSEFDEARTWKDPEPRMKRPLIMKGAPERYISAGHFKVDLYQREKNIKKALTQSWADECGVTLQDNPSLQKNKQKFLLGKNGAQLSGVPESMFQHIRQLMEDDKFVTEDIDQIELLDKIRQECHVKVNRELGAASNEVGDLTTYVGDSVRQLQPSISQMSSVSSEQLKMRSNVNAQASTNMTMATMDEVQSPNTVSHLTQTQTVANVSPNRGSNIMDVIPEMNDHLRKQTITEAKHHQISETPSEVKQAAQRLNQSSSIDRDSVINSSAYNILGESEDMVEITSEARKQNMILQNDTIRHDEVVISRQSHVSENQELRQKQSQLGQVSHGSAHIHVASFEFQRQSPLSSRAHKEQGIDKNGSEPQLD